jgi:tetratricopeptide (TPR) repeat protein
MEFNSAYQFAIQNNRMITDELYRIGINTLEKMNNILEKENILLRLISIYPKKSELYYRMACIFNGDVRSLTWHKICFSIDPCHKDNIITVIKILYSQGLFVRVFDYAETPIFKDLIEDPRFLGIYARCNLQQLYYNNGVTYLLKLIDYYCKKPAIYLEEKNAKWSNYHDLGYVYCVTGDINLSIKYTKKAVDLANKFDLDMWQRLLSFSNVLCYSDFKYSDKTTVFQEYLKIND